MRLQSKILLTLFPAVIFSLLAIGGISHHLITDHTESVLEAQRDHLFADTIEDFATFLENTEANATVFSRMKPVQRYLAHVKERGYRDQSAVVQRFKSIQDDHPQYYEIRLLREDGMEDTRVVSRDIDNRAQNEREMPYFERLLQNSESVTRVLFRNPDNHEWALLIGQQILSEGPSMDTLDDLTVRRAFLALTVDMDILQKRSNRSRLGKKGFLYFVDGTGQVLVKPSGRQVLPSLVNLQAVLRADLGKPSFVGVEGNEYKVSGQHLWDNIYGVAVVPAAEFSGVAIKVILVLIFITVTVLVAAALWFHWHIERRFLMPVRHLGSLAQAIGRGDLETKVDVHSDGEIGELAASIREMSDNLKLSQQREKKLAYFDELTGLPNRLSLRQQLDKLIRQSERNSQQFATMFIDLDDFKNINDALGHYLGDRLLQEAAARIKKNLRTEDFITRDSSDDETPQNMLARLGGDEFTVLLTSINGAHDASRVAKRILIALAEPFQLQNHQAYVGASIGISIFPGDGSSAEQLLKNADVAMYEAKKSGKNNFQYFTSAMNASVYQRLALESSLFKALENDEFILHYQPQINREEESIAGFEALVRWRHPDLGLILPAQFIPLAEETGLIREIGYWVMDKACRQLKRWLDSGYAELCISINMSWVQANRDEVVDILKTLLSNHQIPARNLEIELTESALMQDEGLVIELMQQVRALGVRIAFDDFGTGYSSLSHLRRFPIDTLKIDRSFILDLENGEQSAAIFRSITDLARHLQLRIIAEGIENADQLRFVHEQGCDCVQGNYYSEPLPENEASRFLNDYCPRGRPKKAINR